MSPKPISLCLIVKTLDTPTENWLMETRSFFDQVILASFAPCPKLKILGHKIGAELFLLSSSLNLAEATNLILAESSSEWILTLFSGELLSLNNENTLQDILIKDIDAYYIPFETKSTSEGLKPLAELRLFKKSNRIVFEGHDYEDLIIINPPSQVDIAEGLAIKTYATEKTSIKFTISDSSTVAFSTALNNYRQGHVNLALEQLKKLLTGTTSTHPLAPKLIRMLVEVLLYLGKYEKSLTATEKGLQLYPQFTDLLFFQALCLYRMGHYSNAINTLHECLEKPDIPLKYHPYQGTCGHLALFYLGELYETVGEKKQAVLAYTKSLQLYPSFRHAIERLIKALLSHKSLSETINYLDTFFDFSSPKGTSDLAEIFFDLGYYKASHGYLAQLEQKVSLTHSQIINKAYCLLSFNLFQETERFLKDIYPISPYFQESLKIQYLLFWLKGDFAKGNKILESLVKLTPEDPVLPVYLALHEFTSENPSFPIKTSTKEGLKEEIFYLLKIFLPAGQEHMINVLEEIFLRYANYSHYFELAEFYFCSGFYEKSQRILEELRNKNFRSAKLFRLLGKIQLKNRNYYLAVDFFHQALEIDPQNHLTFLSLSKALNLKALEVIDRGLTLYPDSELLQLKKEELLMVIKQTEEN